ARLRPGAEPDGRERPGRGRRRDGHRHGPLRGLAALGGRPPAQPVPARLQAADRIRRAVDRGRLGRKTRPHRRPERGEGRRRAAVRAHARRGRKRDREGGGPRPQPADVPAAGVGGDAAMSATYTAAATLPEALSALAGGARPIAGGTDLVVGARQGKAPLPDSLVAIHGLGELRVIGETSSGGLRIGALVSHSELVAHPTVRDRYTAIADASAIVGSHATRHVGTLGGNVMNASPAMETGGPLIFFGAEAVLASQAGERWVAVESLLTGPGRTDARPDELLVAIELPAGAGGSCYARLEYRRQMEIAVVGATCSVILDGTAIASARVA